MKNKKKSHTKWYGILINKIWEIRAYRRSLHVNLAEQPCILAIIKGFMVLSTGYLMYAILKDRVSGFSYITESIKMESLRQEK